jgi:hypothetical protein
MGMSKPIKVTSHSLNWLKIFSIAGVAIMLSPSHEGSSIKILIMVLLYDINLANFKFAIIV